MNNEITFTQASVSHESIIFSWLEEPHVREFWDNSLEHKEDILNFIHGKKQTYFFGTAKYFIAMIDSIPFALLLGDLFNEEENAPSIQKEYQSKNGNTIFIDFCIGNKDYLGKGLGGKTLEEFTTYYKKVDPKVDTFFIDPDEDNKKAKHVYEKAGFKHVGDYLPKEGAFINKKTLLMVKKV